MSHWSEELASEQFELFRPIIEWSAEDAAEVVNATLALLEEVYEFNPENVLDVGCGLGYHVTAFAKRGLVAHGLDVGAAFIERATEQAEAAGVGDRTSFFRRDMREVGNLNVGYDLLFSHASFGFFDDASNEALLESFHDRLDPGGVLLLKVPNKDHRLRNWSDSFVHTAETYTHAGEQEYNPQTSRLGGSLSSSKMRRFLANTSPRCDCIHQ